MRPSCRLHRVAHAQGRLYGIAVDGGSGAGKDLVRRAVLGGSQAEEVRPLWAVRV